MTWAWRKFLAAAVAGGILALLTAAGAYAAEPHLALVPMSGPPGTTVTATGSGFCSSCGPVEIDFVARPVAQGITVASDGSFQVTFMVPGGTQAGTNAVNALQQGRLVTQTSFTVTPSLPPPTSTPAPPPLKTPPPGPGPTAAPSPGGGSPSPEASATPSANASQPSPQASGGGTGSARGTASGLLSGPPAATILLSAVAALLVVAAAAALLYRRLRSSA